MRDFMQSKIPKIPNACFFFKKKNKSILFSLWWYFSLTLWKFNIVYTMGKFVITKSENGSFHLTWKCKWRDQVPWPVAGIPAAAKRYGVCAKTPGRRELWPQRIQGKPYLIWKAANHQVIGTSEIYSSPASRDKGIESVKNNATEAKWRWSFC
jgi:uncharacterized protein YegP (UPF0339 family)